MISSLICVPFFVCWPLDDSCFPPNCWMIKWSSCYSSIILHRVSFWIVTAIQKSQIQFATTLSTKLTIQAEIVSDKILKVNVIEIPMKFHLPRSLCLSICESHCQCPRLLTLSLHYRALSFTYEMGKTYYVFRIPYILKWLNLSKTRICCQCVPGREHSLHTFYGHFSECGWKRKRERSDWVLWQSPFTNRIFKKPIDKTKNVVRFYAE